MPSHIHVSVPRVLTGTHRTLNRSLTGYDTDQSLLDALSESEILFFPKFPVDTWIGFDLSRRNVLVIFRLYKTVSIVYEIMEIRIGEGCLKQGVLQYEQAE